MSKMYSLALISFLTICLIQYDVSCGNIGIKAKHHRAFQYLEPALVPMGTYIALEAIPLPILINKPTSSNPDTIDLPTILNNLIDAEIESEKKFISVKKSAPERIEATKRFLAGIKPLKSIRLPMGIFVPQQQNGAEAPQPQELIEDEKLEEMAHRRKLARGMRKVFHNIRSHVEAKQMRQEGAPPVLIDYNATFNGLTPLEAVYVPKGIYIPMSSIPQAGKDTNNPYFSGLLPLSIMQLPRGIFIPFSMFEFPEVPPEIVPTNDTHPCDENEEFQTVCSNASSTAVPEVVATTTLLPDIVDEPHDDDTNKTVAEITFRKWIREQYEVAAATIFHKSAEAKWNFETNITDENERAMIASQREVDLFVMRVALAIRNFPFKNMSDPSLVRLYLQMSDSGDAILPPAKWDEFNKIKSTMLATFSSAKICADTSIGADKIETCPEATKWSYNPQISRAMAISRNSELLLHIWRSYRDATGKAIKDDYLRYLVLKNESSVIDGYPEVGLEWREPFVEPSYKYSDRDFMREVNQIMNQTLPLYRQLHSYVRRKLSVKYPESKIKPTGPIPAHLLGNMWGHNWRNIFELVTPYPKKSLPDITLEMRKQNWTVTQMFQAADTFVTNLGLLPMNKGYWENSVFIKPNQTENDIVCQPTSTDFYNKKDYRTKMCAAVTFEDFIQAHTLVTTHSVSDSRAVRYFMQYKDQYIPFREGANPGFLEAVGNMFTLSISTPTHLRKLKILPAPSSFGNEFLTDINFLLSIALEKIAPIPFSYVVDRYRYDIFASRIPKDKLNAEWWRLVTKYQGICSPIIRTETDFDPGSRYHVPADVPYMQYFVGLVLQFQLHKSLCDASGHAGPLYNCDISGSKEAGKLLQDMMALGSSVPWQDALKLVTGSTKMDAGPLLEYFESLSDWLERENSQSHVGWDLDQVCIPAE